MPQFGHGIPKRARNQQADPKARPRNQECASSDWKRKRSAQTPQRSKDDAAKGARPRQIPIRALAGIRIVDHERADSLVVQGLALLVP